MNISYQMKDIVSCNYRFSYVTISPIRDDVELPEDVKANLLPDDQYTNARFIEDQEAWDQAVADLSSSWQEEVVAYAQ